MPVIPRKVALTVYDEWNMVPPAIVKGIKRLSRRVLGEIFRRKAGDKPWVVTVSGRPMGVALIHNESPARHFGETEDVPYLYNLITDIYTYKGLGGVLIKAIKAELPNINVDVKEDNARALAFFAKHGFTGENVWENNGTYRMLSFGGDSPKAAPSESKKDED
jgi:GNAT superfamily N-acetyltransferase